MNEIERQAARAEALGGIGAKPGEEGSHEEQLLRYLGAVYHEARHGRAEPEELERAVSEVDAHMREHGRSR